MYYVLYLLYSEDTIISTVMIHVKVVRDIVVEMLAISINEK